MFRVFAAAAICFIAACIPPQQSQSKPFPRMVFPEAEYLALPESGTATVTGQAFLKTRGGDVKVAAGNEVFLNPVTSYSEQWHEWAYLARKSMEPYDRRLEKYMRKVVADADGRFTFGNVPAGEYFVVTVIIWEAPVGYRGSLVGQGGTVAKRIKVEEGAHLQVIVTR